MEFFDYICNSIFIGLCIEQPDIPNVRIDTIIKIDEISSDFHGFQLNAFRLNSMIFEPKRTQKHGTNTSAVSQV